MGMKMKTGKKLKGFMCDSHASTAVCMSQDYRSVVEVPRRPDTTLLDRVRLINSTNYVRLGEQRGRRSNIPSSVVGRSFPVSCLKKHQEKVAQEADDAITNSLAVSGHHNVFQVVVMRVSIHCQGCAGKVKKHLSKMEGVTSFSIDLESQRVTVMGHVSPSGVLESISKVKKAEFWGC